MLVIGSVRGEEDPIDGEEEVYGHHEDLDWDEVILLLGGESHYN